jgi:glutamate N-acetyltransferase/amino-acid N-acetyltransferase
MGTSAVTSSSSTNEFAFDSRAKLELPQKFTFAGIHCGIKKSKAADLAIFVSENPCAAAAVYTQNKFRATSIDRNAQITPSSNIRAIVVNSGNANACTGNQGVDNNLVMAETAAGKLSINADQVLTLSTGIIGEQLPINEIKNGIVLAIEASGSSDRHFGEAANAVMTSDQWPKKSSARRTINGQSFSIAACAKGAGMIGPNMATMLCVIATDIGIEASQAQPTLQRAVDQSFNRISVEGHTSTNDAVILLANSAASLNCDDAEISHEFEKCLSEICLKLAKKIPADGEGASHLISIQVVGADDLESADVIARQIASSALVKTAVAGNDPNWGRIVSAAGNAKATLDPKSCSLKINGHAIFVAGNPAEFDPTEVSQSMKANFETSIEITVGDGPATACHWTSDLTPEYVRFNSEYHT